MSAESDLIFEVTKISKLLLHRRRQRIFSISFSVMQSTWDVTFCATFSARLYPKKTKKSLKKIENTELRGGVSTFSPLCQNPGAEMTYLPLTYLRSTSPVSGYSAGSSCSYATLANILATMSLTLSCLLWMSPPVVHCISWSTLNFWAHPEFFIVPGPSIYVYRYEADGVVELTLVQRISQRVLHDFIYYSI